MKKKYLLKAAVFVVVFALLYGVAAKCVTASDYRNYQWIRGFYEEEEDSLDAVYLGSSNCYAFWNSLTAWEEYGITVWPYASNSQSFAAAPYLIEEVRKTQPNAMIIVNINGIGDNTLAYESLHYLLDYMPLSLNKLALTKHLTEAGGYSFADSMEFYFPILRYHSRWSELNSADFEYEVNGFKGASTYYAYLEGAEDISDTYVTSTEVGELSADTTGVLERLLDYCDEKQINVLFVTVPRAEQKQNTYHAMNEMISSRGYPALYLTDQTEEMLFDLTSDFYNETHTNIHGSIKFTRYLSEYLIENYQFTDKRGNEVYRSWDEAVAAYEELVNPFVLEIEKDAMHRNFDLDKPSDIDVVPVITAVENEAEAEYEAKVMLGWEAVSNADGYVIYKRRTVDEVWWEPIIVSQEEYEDEDCWYGEEFIYIVVPFSVKNGEKYYGNFSYSGETVKLM